MNNSTKNKFLIGIIALFILANIISIYLFWAVKPQPDRQKGTPAAFLIKELNLNEKQQEQLEVFREDHLSEAEPLRRELVKNKKMFFQLLQQNNVVDSQIINAEKAVTTVIGKLDLLAYDHFKKVRSICTETQKEKFDKIILKVAQILGNPGDPHPPGDKPPPPNDAEGSSSPNEQTKEHPSIPK